MRRLWSGARRRPWISAGVVVVILAGAIVGVVVLRRPGSATAAAATTRTETVATGTVREEVSATGTLAPATVSALSFGVSGRVTSVRVVQGQKVAAGQVLATVDSAALAASVAQAQATVANAQASVSDDATNSASATQTAADQATLTSAQTALGVAQQDLADANLTSPIAGVVASVNLTNGQSVSGSGSSSASGGGAGGGSGSGTTTTTTSSGSTAQVEVISTTSWIANATVDDTEVDEIVAGNQAELTLSGSTTPVYGTVKSVGVVSSSTSGTAAYPVVISVTGSPAGLHDGASVTVAVIYKQVADVVVVPTLALYTENGTRVVHKIVNGKQVSAPVTIGLSSGGETQVLSGVAEGDQISVPQPVIARTTGGTTRQGTTGGGFGGGGFGGGGGLGGGGFGGGGR